MIRKDVFDAAEPTLSSCGRDEAARSDAGSLLAEVVSVWLA